MEDLELKQILADVDIREKRIAYAEDAIKAKQAEIDRAVEKLKLDTEAYELHKQELDKQLASLPSVKAQCDALRNEAQEKMKQAEDNLAKAESNLKQSQANLSESALLLSTTQAKVDKMNQDSIYLSMEINAKEELLKSLSEQVDSKNNLLNNIIKQIDAESSRLALFTNEYELKKIELAEMFAAVEKEKADLQIAKVAVDEDRAKAESFYQSARQTADEAIDKALKIQKDAIEKEAIAESAKSKAEMEFAKAESIKRLYEDKLKESIDWVEQNKAKENQLLILEATLKGIDRKQKEEAARLKILEQNLLNKIGG